MNPDDHFEGAQLALARAITAHDLTALRAVEDPRVFHAPGRGGATLMAYAVWSARGGEPEPLAVVTALVRRGADPSAPLGGELGSTLDFALGLADAGLLGALLDAGVSADARVCDGEVPALREVIYDATAAHRALLLDRGADPNARDTLGRSAIFWALCELQLNAVDELLDRGANPWVIDLTGLSFGNMLQGLLDGAEPGDMTTTRLGLIRDRVTRMGMPWPPASRAEERSRMRGLGVEPVGPEGEGASAARR